MKKLNPILAAALVALLLLPSCGLKKQLTAFGLYSKAAADISKAGGMEAECTVNIDLGLMAADVTMHLKQNGKNSEIVTYMSGEEVSKSVTFDGMTYLKTPSQKTKTPEAADENAPEQEAIPKIAEELFEDVEVQETAEGRAVTVEIDSETFKSLMKNVNGISPTTTFENAVLTMFFDHDDKISGMHLESDMKLSLPGLGDSDGSDFDFGASVTADYAFINLGQAPEIAPPENADEYVLQEDE